MRSAEVDRLTLLMPLIERLRGTGMRHLPTEDFTKLIALLADQVPQIAKVITPDERPYLLTRGRMLDDGTAELKLADLGPPPAASCRAGRCNRPMASIFYGGMGADLVLDELAAHIGDTVAFLHFRPKHAWKLAVVGGLDNFRRRCGAIYVDEDARALLKSVDISTKEGALTYVIDAFFSDLFRRRGDYHTYRITSAYAETVLDVLKDVDGLIYESVGHVIGSCFAVRPEKFNEINPVLVEVVEVVQDLGYGLYDYRTVRWSSEFDMGNIIWSDPFSPAPDIERLCWT